MTYYISNPLAADPSTLAQRARDYLTSYGPPGFQLAPAHPVSLLIENDSQVAAELADVANQQLDSDFRYLGSLFNLPPIDATPATATATWTMQDTAGYTVSAGAEISLPDASGTQQGFKLAADVVIAPGASTGTGTVVADQAGTVCNGLSGVAQPIQVPAYVTSVSVASSSGGIDAELDTVYKDRLAETFTLLTPRPVLAKDFAVLARSVPGVFRATAVDNLKPGPPYDTSAEATGQEKMVTVAVADINGASVGSTIRANVKAYLQSFRESNFVVWVVDPVITSIDVTAANVYAWPGWNTASVQAAVIAALDSVLSSANFAPDSSGNAARWSNDPVIRAEMLTTAIKGASPGVRYTGVPTFAIHSGSLATTDVNLNAGSSIPALPTPGTISVTVTATT